MDWRRLLLVEPIISMVRAKRRLFSCFSLCFALSLLTFYLVISITTSTEDTYTWFSSVPNAHNSSSSGPMMPNCTEKANIEKRRDFHGNVTGLKRTSHQRNSTSAGRFNSPTKGGFVLGKKGSILAVGKKKKGIVVPKSCDIFDGRWVRDEKKPYYAPGSCPYVDDAFNCIRNGRPDDGFMKWRWQPNGCDIPRLNATAFLEHLRGKRLIFVGDSLNRNMWVSLLCILRQSVPNKKKVFEMSSRRHFKRKGYYSFKFKDYKCNIEYVASTFLVKEVEEKLRLDLLDEATSLYGKADIVVFNTGHWWNHHKTSKGKNYYQEGNYIHPVLKVNKAYAKALTTWANWVDKNIDRSKTHVIFRGYSLTHFRGGEWNSGGQCHKETEPIFNQTFVKKYPTKMRIVDQVLKQMKTPVTFLNISRLTDYRKDGHPSIYRRKYKTVQEKIAAEKSQDCSHWCLPGIPDAWNELLYTSLLKDGKGSWRN